MFLMSEVPLYYEVHFFITVPRELPFQAGMSRCSETSVNNVTNPGHDWYKPNNPILEILALSGRRRNITQLEYHSTLNITNIAQISLNSTDITQLYSRPCIESNKEEGRRGRALSCVRHRGISLIRNHPPRRTLQ